MKRILLSTIFMGFAAQSFAAFPPERPTLARSEGDRTLVKPSLGVGERGRNAQRRPALKPGTLVNDWGQESSTLSRSSGSRDLVTPYDFRETGNVRVQNKSNKDMIVKFKASNQDLTLVKPRGSLVKGIIKNGTFEYHPHLLFKKGLSLDVKTGYVGTQHLKEINQSVHQSDVAAGATSSILPTHDTQKKRLLLTWFNAWGYNYTRETLNHMGYMDYRHKENTFVALLPTDDSTGGADAPKEVWVRDAGDPGREFKKCEGKFVPGKNSTVMIESKKMLGFSHGFKCTVK